MEHWRKREVRKIEELKDYANALERRERFLLDTLAELSRGLGIKQNDSSGWDHAMRALAAKGLKDVAVMRVPPRPFI